jgi:tetratricopeptide (TPR) repeat protein
MRIRPAPLITQLGIASFVGLAISFALEARNVSLVCKFTDQQGKALRNVESQLTLAGTEDHLYQKSDKNGRLSFRNLKTGSYELRAQLKDHVPLKLTVPMTDDRTMTFTLMTRDEFGALEQEAIQAVKAQEFSKAAAIFEKLLTAYPEDAALHDNLGRCYAGLLEEDKAFAEAEKAARLDPQFSNSKKDVESFILRGRGQKALQDKDFAAASRFFDQWIQLDPKNPEAYYGSALAYGHQDKFKEAIAAINRALELDPQNGSYLKVKAILERNASVK